MTPNEEALDIHRRAVAVDMHADTVQFILDEGADISERVETTHLDAPRMREGGLDAQFFSIWVEPAYFGLGGEEAIERADAQIDAVRALAERRPDVWTFATTAADIRRAKEEGKLAALIGLEGGYAIDEKLERVEHYFDRGVRYMTPTWVNSVSWAGSSGEGRGAKIGLNGFGREVVREMNRLGMLVDVSHVSDKTFWDMHDASTSPLIASHSNCRALVDVPRNVTDDMIYAIADTGGVVCVVYFPGFLDLGWRARKDRLEREIEPLLRATARPYWYHPTKTMMRIAIDRVRGREYAKRLSAVPLASVVDHIDHIVKLVGVNHVGCGSDFDGITATPGGLSDVSELPNLTAELLGRGYSEEDVTKILGGNVLRVLEENER